MLVMDTMSVTENEVVDGGALSGVIVFFLVYFLLTFCFFFLFCHWMVSCYCWRYTEIPQDSADRDGGIYIDFPWID